MLNLVDWMDNCIEIKFNYFDYITNFNVKFDVFG